MTQITTTLDCGEPYAACVCSLLKDHDGPHICSCGGAWEDVDGQRRVRSFPGVFAAIFDDLLPREDDDADAE